MPGYSEEKRRSHHKLWDLWMSGTKKLSPGKITLQLSKTIKTIYSKRSNRSGTKEILKKQTNKKKRGGNTTADKIYETLKSKKCMWQDDWSLTISLPNLIWLVMTMSLHQRGSSFSPNPCLFFTSITGKASRRSLLFLWLHCPVQIGPNPIDSYVRAQRLLGQQRDIFLATSVMFIVPYCALVGWGFWPINWQGH